MKKKKKVSEIIWEGLQNLIVIIIFVALFICMILPELAAYKAIADGDLPWYYIFIIK